MDNNTRSELADYLTDEAASTQDADLSEKLMGLADQLEHGQGWNWPGECGFDEGHPSRMVADIHEALEDTVSDLYILLDALWSKDLTLVTEAWREEQAEKLDREAEHIALLLANSARIVRTLEFAEELDHES